MLNLSNKLLKHTGSHIDRLYIEIQQDLRKNLPRNMFEHAVQKLDSLLLNHAGWKRIEHVQQDFVEYDHDFTEQYVKAEPGATQDSVVISARIAYIAVGRLHVDLISKMITVRDGDFLCTVDLEDIQDDRWYGGIVIRTTPQTDPYLIHATVTEVVGAARAVA